jgi:hypothetical protein
MSHYTEVECQIRDDRALVEALKELGFEVEVNQTPVPLYGWHGDLRPERAEVVIRRVHVGHSSNDIGFARQPDGTFKAIISEFDVRQGKDQTWMNKVRQLAAVHTTLLVARRRGQRVERRVDARGRQQVIVHV